jgi:Transposase DDE domain
MLPSAQLTASAPGINILSRLNGWPVHSPADASPTASRMSAHGSGLMWFATPSSCWTLTNYSLPVSRRTNCNAKGYDAGWFRNALAERGIVACIPSKANRKVPIDCDQTLYRQSHKIENMFGRLKDWRRIHTRYDRCAHTFFSAICIAAAVIFWINQ